MVANMKSHFTGNVRSGYTNKIKLVTQRHTDIDESVIEPFHEKNNTAEVIIRVDIKVVFIITTLLDKAVPVTSNLQPFLCKHCNCLCIVLPQAVCLRPSIVRRDRRLDLR